MIICIFDIKADKNDESRTGNPDIAQKQPDDLAMRAGRCASYHPILGWSAYYEPHEKGHILGKRSLSYRLVA
jgi:hypothetical protein